MRLRPGLHATVIDDIPVLIDEGSGKYFVLRGTLAEHYRAFAAGGASPTPISYIISSVWAIVRERFFALAYSPSQRQHAICLTRRFVNLTSLSVNTIKVIMKNILLLTNSYLHS